MKFEITIGKGKWLVITPKAWGWGKDERLTALYKGKRQSFTCRKFGCVYIWKIKEQTE